MEQLLQQIEEYKSEIGAFAASDEKQVEEYRIKWLGTKGIVKAVMGEMKNVPAEKKKEFGQLLNEFKIFAEEKYAQLKESTVNGQPGLRFRPRFRAAERSGNRGRAASRSV